MTAAFHIVPMSVFTNYYALGDRLCGLELPGYIPGATIFSEYQLVWNGIHSAS
jgi:hypothetical protein